MKYYVEFGVSARAPKSIYDRSYATATCTVEVDAESRSDAVRQFSDALQALVTQQPSDAKKEE